MSLNKNVAKQLRLIHDLMLLSGENPFKVIAFDKAAQAVEALTEDIAGRVQAQTLTDVKGIGTSIAKDITEYVTTGRIGVLESLKAKVPPGLIQWLDISGLGPKSIVKIHQSLGISDMKELRAACQDGRVAALPGLGEKSAQKILKSMDWMEQHSDRCRLDQALEVGDRLSADLGGLEGVRRLAIAGSARRMLETIGDIDVLVAAGEADRDAIFDAFTGHPLVTEVLGRGDTKSSVRTAEGRQVDLRIVAPEAFGAALLYFTGSKEHNILLRQRARERGMALNEYGLFDLDREGETDFDKPVTAAREEEEIYEALGLAFIPPERREGRDETTAYDLGRLKGASGTKTVPRLIEPGDLRGVIHAHTNWSDGETDIETLARAAAARGYAYLGLTDHSKSAGYAGGLSEQRVREQWDEIDRLNDLFAGEGLGFIILKGIESDILSDGSLDYPDKLLEGFDFVIASIHSGLDQPAAKIMARYEKALSHPATSMLGHPTGRLLLRREEMPVDMPDLIDMAASSGVAIEINANPYRLDIDWRWGALMREKGVKTCINPDAHAIEGIGDIRYGIGIARKAGFGPADVINAGSAAEFLDHLKRR